MTNREFFIHCSEDEYPVFVNVLKAVPADRLDYRPHPGYFCYSASALRVSR